MLNELWKYFQINDSPSQEGTVYGISATTSNYDKSNVQVGDVIEFHISRGCGQKLDFHGLRKELDHYVFSGQNQHRITGLSPLRFCN